MSEMINNREYRQQILKGLIKELHEGKTVEEVKSRFEELIQGISTREITEMEQALIREGLPVEEIQNLCDVHAAVFKGSIEEIHMPDNPQDIPGHPVHTFKMENRAMERFLKKQVANHLYTYQEEASDINRDELVEDMKKLLDIDKHYSRKENLIFPYLEKYGITAPPKVMWGVDDEIRQDIKNSIAALQSDDAAEAVKKVEYAVERVNEMIFKEDNILFPMTIETLTEDEWLQIEQASAEIGFLFYEPKIKWTPKKKAENTADSLHQASEAASSDSIGAPVADQPVGKGLVSFDAGALTPEELNAMLNTLPFDITFVDKNDIVKYFTQGKERIFPRPKTVIGREVKNCHPPASVHIVEQIVEDLRTGKKDHEDFWINMRGQFVHIRYYAVRNTAGEFLGVMEVTQDIKPLRDLTGEKRLVSE